MGKNDVSAALMFLIGYWQSVKLNIVKHVLQIVEFFFGYFILSVQLFKKHIL